MVLSKVGRHSLRNIMVQSDMAKSDFKKRHTMERNSKTL